MAKTKQTKAQQLKGSSLPIPPPAMSIEHAGRCAVDELNGRIHVLLQMRDALISIENMEQLDGNKKMSEVRERIQNKIHDYAKSLLEWRAQE